MALALLVVRWILCIIAATAVGISGIIPLLLIPNDYANYLSSRAGRNYMNCFLSFAVGSILGDVFVHLLPETWILYETYDVGHHNWIGIIIIIGILVFLVIEKICNVSRKKEQPTQNENEAMNEREAVDAVNDNESDAEGTSVRRRHPEREGDQPVEVEPAEPEAPAAIDIEGYLNLLANVIDNFSHGLAVGGSFCVSIRVGLLTTICILVHEIPHEMSDFVILLRAGFDRRRAAFAQLGTASSCIVGTIFALIVDSATAGLSKAYILPFTCGGFIYIALVTLVPELAQEENPQESLKQICLVFLGVIITSLLAMCHL